MIRVQCWHNATVMIEVDGYRVLCDPWLVGRAYMGAWSIWPPLPEDVIERIRDCDAIFLSHIHPDHYSPETLRAYMKRWGERPILCTEELHDEICSTFDMFLDREWAEGQGMHVISNANGVDSALVFGGICNLNDNPYDQRQVDEILRLCPEPQIALLPFAPAGPWPQTYYDDPLVLDRKAAEKKAEFLRRFEQYKEALKPKIAIPFAGQYALCGRLWFLNQWRGQSDATEAGPAFYPGGGVEISDDGAVRFFDLRHEAYPDPSPELAVMPLEWEDADLNALFDAALRRAGPPPCMFAFSTTSGMFKRWIGDKGPQISIQLHPTLLERLLRGTYHWSDAEIGSHYRCRREPDVYDQEHMRWLWELHQ